MNSKSGFTFLEVFIAMLIVVILSGIVGLQLYSHLRKAKVEASRMQIKTFKAALQLYRASHDRPFERYLSAFWQKLLMPLTVFAMVLLATPISANLAAGRDRSFGINMGIGAVVGILFYLGAQIIFALGQLLGWSIPLVAVVPAAAVMACALVLLKRMRW